MCGGVAHRRDAGTCAGPGERRIPRTHGRRHGRPRVARRIPGLAELRLRPHGRRWRRRARAGGATRRPRQAGNARSAPGAPRRRLPPAGREPRRHPQRRRTRRAAALTQRSAHEVPSPAAARHTVGPTSRGPVMTATDATHDDARAYAESVRDPDGYWRKAATRLDWIVPPTQIRDVSFDLRDFRIRWYADGVLNASVECLDRHLAA